MRDQSGEHYDNQKRDDTCGGRIRAGWAAERGVSRAKLIRVVMRKVVEKKLVPEIIDDEDLIEWPVQQYRRFRKSS